MMAGLKYRSVVITTIEGTGPKKVHGKRRSARNAFRHGLSIPVQADPKLSEQVKSMARQIVNESDDDLYQHACHIAEAQIDLIRIRQLEQKFIADRIKYAQEDENKDEMFFINRVRSGKELPDRLPANMKSVTVKNWQTAKIVYRKHDWVWYLVEQLIPLDRYERRALSRRKFAIRAFDEAKRRANECRATAAKK